MSNPSNVATQESNSAQADSFEQQVNNVTRQLTEGESGTYQLPDNLDVSEEVAFAANAEKRRRDTQSALSTTRQKLAAAEEVNSKLEAKLLANAQPTISQDMQDNLDDLKAHDPDEWRAQMNKLESDTYTTNKESLSAINAEARQVSEQQSRTAQLVEYNKENPDFPIDDSSLENDIPPRITKKLEQGKITFEEFLAQASDYMQKGTVVATGSTENDTTLTSLGGGSEPTDSARTRQAEATYETEIY